MGRHIDVMIGVSFFFCVGPAFSFSNLFYRYLNELNLSVVDFFVVDFIFVDLKIDF